MKKTLTILLSVLLITVGVQLASAQPETMPLSVTKESNSVSKHKTVPVTCVDPDQGPEDVYTKSTITSAFFSFTDSCVDDFNVREFFCDDNRPSSFVGNCSAGCSNGACNPSIDLFPTNINVLPPTFFREQTEVSYNVFKTGIGTPGAFVVSTQIRINGVETFARNDTVTQDSSLIYQFQERFDFTSGDEVTIISVVDSQQDVAEVNEGNNVIFRTVTIQ